MAALLLAATVARAQYYSGGRRRLAALADDPHPRCAGNLPPTRRGAIARRTLHFIEAAQPSIGYGFRHGPLKIPFVMHPENFRSNGLVMWLPKRVEFLTSPAIDSYSMPWYKQLVAHEYRHAVQYNNLNRGVIKGLSYVLGQQGSTVGLLLLPIWLIEGDAVQMETQMSSFGRALQPSFTMEYRALGDAVRSRRNIDRWFCGSYHTNVPDHYHLGYQIAAYADTATARTSGTKVAWYGARNPYMIFTTSIALKKFYRTDVGTLFAETFDGLNYYWNALPARRNSSRYLSAEPVESYTTYAFPLAVDAQRVLALKTDYDRPTRFVTIDTESGRERAVAYTGSVSTRPAYADGRVWWTEYRRSTLFEQRVNSQLCYMDLDRGKPKSRVRAAPCALPHADRPRAGMGRILARRAFRRHWRDGCATLGGSGADRTARTGVGRPHRAALLPGHRRFGHVARPHRTRRDGHSSDRRGLHHAERPHGPRRAALFRIDRFGLRRGALLRPGHGAPVPALDLDLRLVLAVGRRRGQRADDHLRRRRLPRRTAADRHATPRAAVAPAAQRRQSAAPQMARGESRHGAFHGGRLRLVGRTPPRAPLLRPLHLFKVHSWMPVAVNPFKIIDEHDIDVQLGVTLVSQNLPLVGRELPRLCVEPRRRVGRRGAACVTTGWASNWKQPAPTAAIR